MCCGRTRNHQSDLVECIRLQLARKFGCKAVAQSNLEVSLKKIKSLHWHPHHGRCRVPRRRPHWERGRRSKLQVGEDAPPGGAHAEVVPVDPCQSNSRDEGF